MTEQLQQVPPTPQPVAPPWRGINHLALITDDMDATVRFYHGTLGARLVATIGTADFKHYFFEFGPECTVAFFEYAEHQARATRQGGRHPASTGDPVRPLVVQRARRRGVARSPAPPEGARVRGHRRGRSRIMRSVYFTDPNGIALEASWWVLDATGRPRITATPHSSPTPSRCRPSASSLSAASSRRCLRRSSCRTSLPFAPLRAHNRTISKWNRNGVWQWVTSE